MKSIPTAEAFLEGHYKKVREHFLTFHNGNYGTYEEYKKSNPLKTLQECMIEFAKLHVQAALQAALEEVPYGSSTDTVSYEDVSGILTCYPLDLIK